MTFNGDLDLRAAHASATPLRICVASSGLGHVARGIETWAEQLAAELAARRLHLVLCKGAGPVTLPYERVVACWTRESDRTRRWLSRLPRRLGWRLGMGSPYEVEQTSFAWNLMKVLRREAVDVLHVQDPLVALLVQRWCRWFGLSTRTILAHGTEEPLWFQQRIRYLQHLAPWHSDQAERAGISRPTWTTIPNFIDTEQFRPGRAVELRRELGIPEDAIVVVTAAAIKRKHKRIDHLLDEFANLRATEPDLPVWLVVAGGWSEETDELVREGRQRLGERVRFLVRFPHQRMPELYRAGDIFTLASLLEMMPIALLEAAASGLPCVIHPHPVMRWMTAAGGYPCDMELPGALARALGELSRHPARRKQLGNAARLHSETLFAKSPVVDQILAYYAQVAGGQAPHDSRERRLS